MSATPEAAAREVALLRAGALLPASSPLPPGEPADLVSARAYRHPALGDRAVVRLTPEPLAPADDAELEVLGFGGPEVRPRVAKARRRNLGFPGWALIHDPARARFALGVVKELKTQAKLARAKPGHAKEGFDRIAQGLSRSVPHFLPSFWEEAGRAFLDSGNAAYASAAFAKAREAERVHALKVDPAARDRAFLEYALAGAVSGKALSEYAQELGDAGDPAGAYARFRELCVRRTLGGLPPWAGMAKDLKRLQKLAGVDPDAEEERLLRELLGAPSLVRAGAEFWTAYAPALARLARGAPEVRGELLRIVPEPAGDRARFAAKWIDLLEKSGALEGVIEPRGALPPQVLPPDGAAGWLSRLLRRCQGYRSQTPDSVFALIRRMAPRLRADAQPVAVAGGWAPDLDVLDLLFELEAPVADPPKRLRLQLDQWIKPTPGSSERPRDPVHVARDARYRPLLEESVGRAMGTAGFEATSRAMKGLAEARRSWILQQIAELAGGALPAFEQALNALSAALSASSFADLLEAWAALREVDVAQALAHTLGGGIADELGWPELEAEADELKKAGGGGLEVRGTYPYAIVRSGLKVAVLGPQGRALEHELRLPKGANLQHLELTYVQGQLLVGAWVPSEGYRSYWSGRPDELFESTFARGWGMETRIEIELPDGALVRGGRALHAGDRPTEPALIFSDGATLWVQRQDALHELDPKTGAAGRKSLPRFLEEYVQEGKELALSMCSLHPLPPALRDRTPLGSRDGLAGLRARRAADGALECEGIDGRSARLPQSAHGAVVGLLRLPGLERPLALLATYGSLELVGPGGRVQARLTTGSSGSAYAKGSAIILAAPLWHLLRVRDEPGSRALRTVAPEDGRALVAAVRADKALAALSERLPSITDPRLRDGVLGLATKAEKLEAQLGRLRAAWDPATAKAAPAALQDALVARGLGPLVEQSGRISEGLLGAELAAVAAFLRAEPDPKPPPSEQIQKSPALSGFRWDELLGATGAMAFVASSPTTPPEVRQALAGLLEVWASLSLAGAGDRYRRCLLTLPMESPYSPVSNSQSGLLTARADGRWFVLPRRTWGAERNYAALGAASSGRPELLPGSAVAEEDAVDDRPWSAERLRDFVKMLADRGPRPVPSEVVAELSRRTGLARPQAALLFAGLPGLDSWEAEFLGKERREVLALKAAEAKVARDELKKVAREVRREVLSAAAAGELAALWQPLGEGPEDEKSPVARLAAAWNRRMGQRASVDEAVIVRCAKELPRLPVDTGPFLSALARCAESPPWTRDAAWQLGEHGVAPASGDDGAQAFSDAVAQATAVYLPFLFDALRVGDPLLAQLSTLLKLSRERLASPQLLLGAGAQYLDEKSRPPFLDAVGSEAYPPGGDGSAGRDGGFVVARGTPWSVRLAARPAQLASAPAHLAKLVESAPSIVAARLLLSDGYARLAARAASTPVPEGGYEANPALSVPSLVAEVKAARDLSEDAAALYLQTLAHRAPTSKAVQTWNGWTAARYEKAAKELCDRKLLLEAKRARAGRDFFLPGGWEDLKAPDLPLETWKLPLYGAVRSGAGFSRPLGVLLPLRPTHELFEEAWGRVKSGDAPGYEEVK